VLAGTVLIDVSLGDVQYGTVAGNVTLQFGGWAPSGTQSNLQLQLAVSNSLAVISFPSEVVFANNNFGVTTLENYAMKTQIGVAAEICKTVLPSTYIVGGGSGAKGDMSTIKPGYFT
jgi:hypothetical protein